jgi:retinal rod rhodopsin-sensitive cGMP 3',5'-cyclic phosphodiesterase subunit delta
LLDADSNELLWSRADWPQAKLYDEDEKEEEITVNFPKKILGVSELSRSIEFSTEEKIENLSLMQRMFLNGQEIEDLYFKFGFCIPQSVNTWEQIIVSD